MARAATASFNTYEVMEAALEQLMELLHDERHYEAVAARLTARVDAIKARPDAAVLEVSADDIVLVREVNKVMEALIHGPPFAGASDAFRRAHTSSMKLYRALTGAYPDRTPARCAFTREDIETLSYAARRLEQALSKGTTR